MKAEKSLSVPLRVMREAHRAEETHIRRVSVRNHVEQRSWQWQNNHTDARLPQQKAFPQAVYSQGSRSVSSSSSNVVDEVQLMESLEMIDSEREDIAQNSSFVRRNYEPNGAGRRRRDGGSSRAGGSGGGTAVGISLSPSGLTVRHAPDNVVPPSDSREHLEWHMCSVCRYVVNA